MSGSTPTPTRIFSLQARLDIEQPHLFIETLRISQEMEVIKPVGDTLLRVKRVKREHEFDINRESLNKPITYEEDGTWFHFCFDPDTKTAGDAINEFKEYARVLFRVKYKEHQNRVMTLNMAMDNLAMETSIVDGRIETAL